MNSAPLEHRFLLKICPPLSGRPGAPGIASARSRMSARGGDDDEEDDDDDDAFFASHPLPRVHLAECSLYGVRLRP